jgi:hypothetical protein
MLRPSMLAPWGDEMWWEKVSQPVALTSPACGKTERGWPNWVSQGEQAAAGG